MRRTLRHSPGRRRVTRLARRLAETAEKEVWNGSTLVGPHRDDLVFELAGRDLASFASRGQQRTAILALKLAELDVLTALDGRSPLLLLDDVFSRARSGAARRTSFGGSRPCRSRSSPRRRSTISIRSSGPSPRAGRSGSARRAPSCSARDRACWSSEGAIAMTARQAAHGPPGRADARCRPRAGAGGRAAPLPGDGHLRGPGRRARARRRRGVPGGPARGLQPRRRGRCADRGAGAAAAWIGAARPRSRRPRAGWAHGSSGCTSARQVAAYNPRHLPAI